MGLLLFSAGVVVGSIATIVMLLVIAIRFNKRRKVLYRTATSLYEKAGELFETARIWYQIGNKEESAKALDEATRLVNEAKDIEDEADGKKAS